MTKKKSVLLKTSENRRVSPYGEYYISVKKIEMLEDEREDHESLYSSPPRFPYPRFSFGYPMLIRAVFESDEGYFGKTSQGRWVHNIPLSTSAYNVRRGVYHFDISIYFPSLTTLNIIKGKHFIRLLLGDKEVYDALVHSLDWYDMHDMPDLPGTPPRSSFENFLKRQIVDIETRLKLQTGYQIAFEDIGGAQNVEVREQALRKFGYEDYVKEGFKKKKIVAIIIDKEVYQSGNNLYVHLGTKTFSTTTNRMDILTKRFNPKHNEDEKIIVLVNDIAFLQVKDTTTNKTYFLKVPPNMRSVEEAKAWTFGLDPGEYNPVVET